MKAKPEIICGLICISALFALGRVVVHRWVYVETNNATLQGNYAPISSEVPGEITRVFVEENQPVLRGQLLCLFDERPFRAALDEAIEEKEALRAQLKSATRDARRAAWLFRKNATTAASRDQAFAREKDLAQQVLAAEAKIESARQDLRHAAIRAPADGVIAFRSAQSGAYVKAGAPLFGFVSDRERWVEAKVKETDLPGIRVGDKAEVRFDALPGKKFEGRLEDLGVASEAQFAAVPDDFSAGNFTKRVQYIPVRVRLKLTPEQRKRLPIGASSVVEMKRVRS